MRVRDRTAVYAALRAPCIEQHRARRTRLELRFVKIASALQSALGGGEEWTAAAVAAARKIMEESVAWEPEQAFRRCRFCGQRFTLFRRKHHCRLCGLVTCGSADSHCSREVPTTMLAEKLAGEYPQLESVHTLFPLRICVECRRVLLAQQAFEADCRSDPPPLLKLHARLAALEREFQSALSVQTSSTQTAPERVRLVLKLCARYDTAVKQLRALNVELPGDVLMQAQMLRKCALVWENAVLPLRRSAARAASASSQGAPASPASPRNKHDAQQQQQELVVLQEQHFLLEKQLEEAKSRRHFDAYEPLRQSLEELSREIERRSEALGFYAPSA